MPRLTLALVGLVGVLAGALGVTLVNGEAGSSDRQAVRQIVSEVLAEQQPAVADAAAIDAAVLNPMIENYLMSNPRVLERVSAALQEEIATARREETRTALASISDQVFNDPQDIVLGNPNGDVTLVELFDYNCGFCRQALPDLATLLDEDPNLRVILKEFPILSEESMQAARVAVVVGESDADYWAFHQALFTSRGQVNGETALNAAADLGLNKMNIAMDVGTPRVQAVIDKSYQIADTLKITGTPTYIIGDEVIPGAVGIDQLRSRIANMRACGATVCPASKG